MFKLPLPLLYSHFVLTREERGEKKKKEEKKKKKEEEFIDMNYNPKDMFY